LREINTIKVVTRTTYLGKEKMETDVELMAEISRSRVAIKNMPYYY